MKIAVCATICPAERTTDSSDTRGGDVCVYINKNGCADTTVVERHCCTFDEMQFSLNVYLSICLSIYSINSMLFCWLNWLQMWSNDESRYKMYVLNTHVDQIIAELLNHCGLVVWCPYVSTSEVLFCVQVSWWVTQHVWAMCELMQSHVHPLSRSLWVHHMFDAVLSFYFGVIFSHNFYWTHAYPHPSNVHTLDYWLSAKKAGKLWAVVVKHQHLNHMNNSKPRLFFFVFFARVMKTHPIVAAFPLFYRKIKAILVVSSVIQA